MFEFFEGMIEKIGVKLIGNFTDKLLDFIEDVKENKGNNDKGLDHSQIGSSGYEARIGRSGYGAQIGSSGDVAQKGSKGDEAQ